MDGGHRTSDRASQQKPAPIGPITPTFKDAGASGQKRGVERIGQQNRGVEAAKRIASAQWDDVVHAAHQRKQGRDRRPRGHGDRRVGAAAPNVGNRWQRHHGVTQPVRRHDHKPLHDGLIVSTMKIALLQIDPTVGDLAGNARLIADAALSAKRAGAELAVTPELALAGYLPRDLLLNAGFVNRCWTAAAELARELANGPAVLVGLPEPNPSDEGRPLFNTAVLLKNGTPGQRFRKSLLPTYDVFDEDRYFEPFRGSEMLEFCNRRLGISICEDVWNDRDFWERRRYHFDPCQELAKAGAQAIINLSASPFAVGKYKLRDRMLGSMAAKHKVPVLYVNQFGGNDDLVFDGRSSAFSSTGQIIARGRAFAPDVVVVDLDAQRPIDITDDEASPEAEIWDALVLGTRDYVRKCGFSSV